MLLHFKCCELNITQYFEDTWVNKYIKLLALFVGLLVAI